MTEKITVKTCITLCVTLCMTQNMRAFFRKLACVTQKCVAQNVRPKGTTGDERFEE